jgi:hypothetical protein
MQLPPLLKRMMFDQGPLGAEVKFGLELHTSSSLLRLLRQKGLWVHKTGSVEVEMDQEDYRT